MFFFIRRLDDLTDLKFFTSSDKASQAFGHWWLKVLAALLIFLAMIWEFREWRGWWLCTKELFVNITCNRTSKVPVVYGYIDCELGWELLESGREKSWPKPKNKIINSRGIICNISPNLRYPLTYSNTKRLIYRRETIGVEALPWRIPLADPNFWATPMPMPMARIYLSLFACYFCVRSYLID